MLPFFIQGNLYNLHTLAYTSPRRGGWAKARADKTKSREAEATAKGSKNAGTEKQRIIIYVIGGVAYVYIFVI